MNFFIFLFNKTKTAYKKNYIGEGLLLTTICASLSIFIGAAFLNKLIFDN